MTAPRRIVPGACYLITRRCAQRQFLLRPSRAANQIFLFALAISARRFGIRIHAYCVLSNHFHLVLTDPGARLPAFLQLLDGVVARAMNRVLGRRESFWAPSSYSAVMLVTPADAFAKCLYTLANPVAAGLVRHARDWPGLWSSPSTIGRVMQVPRPPEFFGPGESETAELQLSPPPGCGAAERLAADLAAALAAREAQLAADPIRQRTGFLGALAVLRQRPTARAARVEPQGGLHPTIACHDPGLRARAIRILERFHEAYAEAWAAFRNGARDVLFPAGTYGPCVILGARCAEA